MEDIRVAALFCLGLISMFVTCVATDDQNRLLLVQAIFRHGDRSPQKTYPNDRYRSYWKQGWGQLTQEGKRQAYNLGKFFKNRYGDGQLLSSRYIQSEITIASSDYDRTLMSAYCVLSGLYPPNGTDQLWNADIDWQPIPVHTKPRDEDYEISYKSSCPKYSKLVKDYSGNNTMANFVATHQNLVNDIVRISGLPRDSWKDIEDILYCQHDSTLVALMRVLDVFDNIHPLYSSCVMMELWKKDNSSFVRILYKNETENNKTHSLKIPGCIETCPFEDFVNILSSSIPKNILEECKDEQYMLGVSVDGPTIGVLVLIALFSLLIIIIAILSVYIYRARQSSRIYRALPAEDEDL
ncbi:testicular acid phosphatase homolog isoform X2 [Argopecten irradians]|uniref:testicular acid phosphatase homolog isoform X2 n=1 Tax=Argopecten irradians TaxID=31199 RepID=UPI003719731B